MLGVAAIFGSLSIFAANKWLETAAEAQVVRAETAPAAPKPEVIFGSIVVAKQPLRYGAAITPGDLSEIPWPKDAVPDGAYRTVKDLVDDGARVVLSPIEANEPVLLAKLSGPNGRATLSNTLSPGMQAVTIPADEVTGVGGFLSMGDRVDVVLTRNGGSAVAQSNGAEETGAAKGVEMITETVVSGARVLSGRPEDGAKSVQKTVTLEVTPADARRIALARSVGQLSLTLLSASAPADGTRDSATLSSLTGMISTVAGESVPASTDKPAVLTEVKVTRGLKGEVYNVPSSNGADGKRP
ncbi:Flp pilus assembly protein CpaB [Zhengella mangrovi]|uniref:Flp pilus assembly protein CpaB n=2 Tax=Zhengella mangrovi TaxID=1982044 RepID=A0A2G1QHS7_9HYPH|nr:Flp pilus assembly protein CpaB [Zhengella mangrovi]